MAVGSTGRGWLAAAGVALLAACAEEGPSGPGGVSGQGGAGGTPGVEALRLFTGEAAPRGLALDDAYLYWASSVGLRRGRLEGGAAETLLELEDLQDVVVVGEELYLYRGALFVETQIGRVARAGGEPTWLATGSEQHGMVASDSGVFWAEVGAEWNEGSLWRAALDGSVARIASGLVGPRQLAVDGEDVYFANGNVVGCSSTAALPCVETGLYRVPIAGGEVERVLATSAASNAVWDEGSMYWLAGDPRGAELMLLPPNGAWQPLADVLMDSVAGSTRLSSDGQALYWATESRVLRMPFETRLVERLITGLDGVLDVAVRGDWVYTAEWATGRILRVPTDGSAHRPTAAPITGPCPQPIGTAEELALTPRADPNLELLALEKLEPESLVVSQPTYDRVASDVAAIRRMEPSLVEVGYRAASDGRTLQLEWSTAASAAFDDGQYTAWSCLNDAYGLKDFRTLPSGIELVLKGTYDIDRVFELYRQLPEVTGGTPYLGGSDGPTICVTRAGDSYDYVFDDTGGNCAVCEQHVGYHFQSTAAGQVTPIARWDSTTDAAVPAWFTDICGFRPQVGF